MHSLRRSVPLAAVLAVSVLVIASFPGDGWVMRFDQRLPQPVAMNCAVNAGVVVYVFGGATKGAILDTIYAVDPETGRTSVLPYRLPSPRKMASAVWTGSEAYIIGGIGYDAEPIAEMVRFVPGEGVQVVEGVMPYGTKGVPSIWDGEAVHVLGNCLSAEVGQHDVIKYHPGNGTTEVLEDVLPIPGAGSSAVWADDRAYIVGGRLNQTILSDRIVSYVPGEGAEFVDARLPQGRIGAASAWDGERIHTFGGTIALECGPLECVPTDYLDEIVEFDPANDTCVLTDHRLHRPMDLRAAVHTVTDSGTQRKVIIPGGLTSTGPVDWVTVFWTEGPLHPHPSGPENDITQLVLEWTRDNLGLVILTIVLIVAVLGTFVYGQGQGNLKRDGKTLADYQRSLVDERDDEG